MKLFFASLRLCVKLFLKLTPYRKERVKGKGCRKSELLFPTPYTLFPSPYFFAWERKAVSGMSTSNLTSLILVTMSPCAMFFETDRKGSMTPSTER